MIEIGPLRDADALFDRLLDLPPEQRLAALAGMTEDPALRARVERLLIAHARVDGPLDTPIAVTLKPTAADIAVGRRLGDWIIEAELARGGMSVVYRARHVARPEQVAALKLLTLGALVGAGVERFEREQAILSRLHHPHIVPLFDAGVAADGTPWLTMALVEGSRIDQWCETRAISPRERVALVLSVCEAVSYAHQRLIVHRDLKPSNVLVDHRGHVRLLDFGIASIVDEGAEASVSMTRAATLGYAAPEHLRGARPATTMDVYGLGALLHRLLLGRAPDASTRASSDLALDRDLRAIIDKCLALEPGDRYGSVDALSADLIAWRDGMPVAARAGTRAYRLARWLRRHALLAGAGAMIVLAIATGMGLTWWQAQRAERARAEAERAASRAQLLTEYLVGIFNAEAPDRPRAELPTTAELLAEGERLALSLPDTDPDVRIDLLDAIIRVRLRRNDHATAERLIDVADRLIAERGEQASAATRARVLIRRGALHMQRGRYEDALAILRDAENLIAADERSPLLAEIRLDIGTLLIPLNRPAEALVVLEPVFAALQSRRDLPPRLFAESNAALGMAHAALGNLAASQDFYERQVELARQGYGDASYKVAIALANAGGGARRLGRFAIAREHLTEALRRYDAIGPEPSEYRGGANVALGWLALATGEFAQALEAFDRGNREIARARGLADPERYDFLHLSRGIVRANAGQWREAIAAFRVAEPGFAARPRAFDNQRAVLHAWLGRAQCSVDDAAIGRAHVGVARGFAALSRLSLDADIALLEEADAACALVEGQPERALALLRARRARDHAQPLGFAAEVARRHALAATADERLGDRSAAIAELDAALAILREADLATHPAVVALRDRRAALAD